MWNPNSMPVEEDDSWEVKAFAEDTGNAMGTTWPPRSYTCTFCRREFRSAQALGGHMNVHRRDRARLHQTQLNLKNPNLSLSSSPSCLVPSEELVADGGLCLLFSLPNPNAIFKPSSINHLHGNPSHLLSITPNSSVGNLMNYPGTVVAPHSFSYSPSNSSNNDASTPTDQVSLDNKRKKMDLAVEGVDLELRLGSGSSGS